VSDERPTKKRKRNTAELSKDAENSSSSFQFLNVDAISSDVSKVRYVQSNVERVDGSLPDDPRLLHSVVHFKESLVTLDSDAFDKYIRRVQQFRSLSPEEREEIKQITRRIKNRESARRSRAEKKDKMSDLEQDVNGLRNQLDALKLEVATLNSENRQLRSELNFTQHLVNSNPTLRQMYLQQSKISSPVSPNSSATSGRFLSTLSATSSVGVALSPFNRLTPPPILSVRSPDVSSPQSPLTSHWTTTSLVLFFLLFSFGIFVPASLPPGNVSGCPFSKSLAYLQPQLKPSSEKMKARVFHDASRPPSPSLASVQVKISLARARVAGNTGSSSSLPSVSKLMGSHSPRVLTVG